MDVNSPSARRMLLNNPPRPGVLTHVPFSAVVSPAGISQHAAESRKWSTRAMSTIANIARTRSIHRPDPSACIRSQLYNGFPQT